MPDKEGISRLRSLLAKTQLEKAPLRLAYNAEEHGWSVDAFHERVNTFGAGLLVAKTVGGTVCGGYNPRGWIGKAFCCACPLPCAVWIHTLMKNGK